MVSDDRGETYDRRYHPWIWCDALLCISNNSRFNSANYICTYFFTEIRQYRNLDGMAVWMAGGYGADDFLLQESAEEDAR